MKLYRLSGPSDPTACRRNMKQTLILLIILILSPTLWATPEEDFLTALRESRLQDARFYLEDDNPVNSYIDGESTALILMCREDRSPIVRWLLEQGADPDKADRDGITPLMHAAVRGNRNIVQILLLGGATINLQAPVGTTALQMAINAGRNDLARYLEDRGGLIIDGYYEHPVLNEIWTRRQHSVRALKYLETRWVHYDFLNTLINGDYRALRDLLDEGADPDAADTEDVTALMLAASSPDAFKAELLLDRGASVGRRDSMDLTALWYAAYRDNTGLIDLLMEHGAADDAAFLESSPLFGAFCSGAYDALEKLLDLGFDPGKSGRLGAFLVHYAAFQGDLRTLRELDRRSVSLKEKDSRGLTVLDYLIQGFNLSGDETLFMPVAGYLRDKGVEATLSSSSLDNLKLSRIIYSKW